MKIAFRTLATFGFFLLATLLLVLFQSVSPLQHDPKISTTKFPGDLNDAKISVDSLWNKVDNKKSVPSGFEKAALIAYSAYPQLKDVTIEMVLTQSGAPMESNFDLKTVFGSRESRVYRILLNNAKNTDFDPILLRNLPFDAQVGILAHELGHVAYYHQHSSLQLAKWGLMYLIDDDFRAIHERSTDLMAVYHGLGHQIVAYAWYVRNDPSCRSLYEAYGKEFIDKYYMTDREIKEVLRKHPVYY